MSNFKSTRWSSFARLLTQLLVAITYLHHHHSEVPHYTPEGWSYVKGALATVDREFGFIGKHLFHGIIEKHVIHHLFP